MHHLVVINTLDFGMQEVTAKVHFFLSMNGKEDKAIFIFRFGPDTVLLVSE